MNAADTIQAAIEKLESDHNRATSGEWWTDSAAEWVFAGPGLSNDVLVVDNARLPGDADLIVTLHRTIDAQLAILSDAARAWADPLPMAMFGGGDMREGIYAYHLHLARAILGEVS